MAVRRPVSIVVDKDGNQAPSFSRHISDELAKEVPMPTYTIFEDPPWKKDGRASMAPTASSVYSEDVGDASMSLAEPPSPLPPQHRDDDNNNNTPDRFHAHPQQQINDHGPQQRTSKLPIFQQVRSMLHKPSPLVTPNNTTKWDQFSGGPSLPRKAAQVKPDSHVNPYQGAFEARHHSSERAKSAQRDVSPVSVLQDDDIKPTVPLKAGRNTPSIHSPVSSLSTATIDHFDHQPPNAYLQPSQGKTAKLPKSIKRKPVSTSSRSASENIPPQRKPSTLSSSSSPGDGAAQNNEGPRSRFSWTTVATSVAPHRQSMDTNVTKTTEPQQDTPQLPSRFSWSTINTAPTNHGHMESEAPEPPPPIPQQYANNQQYTKNTPMQSILSRSRPIQRQEEQWTPPRKTSSPVSRTGTPTSRTKTYPSNLTPNSTSATTGGNNSGKAKKLPPPPAPSIPQSHLDDLLSQEKDVQQQRRNIAKAIADLEKVEKASPLEVTFAQVKDAKRELERLRRRMDEVSLEEAEVGRAIVRARRKEEASDGFQGSGLWVRRVTG
ncbi:hypothetical protein MBLNU230_g3323t1 [Neophaeotheca triangularis]